MKKLMALVGLSVFCSAGNAVAICANMNISSSGGVVAIEGHENVYGPFEITCKDLVIFRFQDLSGSKPESIIRHVIEQKVFGSWQNISTVTSNGASKVERSFFPSSTGQYRYRIENAGNTVITNWRMDGRMPMFTIPGT